MKNPWKTLLHMQALRLGNLGWRKCYLFPTLAPSLFMSEQPFTKNVKKKKKHKSSPSPVHIKLSVKLSCPFQDLQGITSEFYSRAPRGQQLNPDGCQDEILFVTLHLFTELSPRTCTAADVRDSKFLIAEQLIISIFA